MSHGVKVGLMGGPSSGKSTLIAALESMNPDPAEVAFAEEQARKYFEEVSVPPEDREKPEVQGAILDRIIANERSIVLTKPRATVTDRTVLDPVVYTFVAGYKFGAQELLERAKSWLPTYSHFYLLDIHDIEHRNDSVRYEDEAHRERIHEGYIGFLALNGIDYDILSGSLEHRLAIVQSVLA